MATRLKNIILTGGAGFLGSRVAIALAGRGHKVTVIDDLSTGLSENAGLGDSFVRLDVRDRSAVQALLARRRPKVVIHLAGRYGPSESIEYPERVSDLHIGGTSALVAAMRSGDVRRLIQASSIEVYGQPDDLPATESAELRPLSPYARSRVAVEALLAECAEAWGLEPVVLRFASLGGVGSNRNGVIGRLLRAARRPDPKRAFRDSDRSIDLLHVDDAAEAIVSVVVSLEQGQSFRGPVNVSTGLETEVRDLVRRLFEITGREFPVAEQPLPTWRSSRLCASPTLIGDLTGWQPRRSDPEDILKSAWSSYC
jgi:UDP-glucose 4-epimerase